MIIDMTNPEEREREKKNNMKQIFNKKKVGKKNT